jgi:hypothetical protein
MCRLQNHYVLNHPHVIQLKDVFVTGDYLNVVLELAPTGMLFGHVNESIRNNGGVMPEDDARWVLLNQVGAVWVLCLDMLSPPGLQPIRCLCLKARPGDCQFLNKPPTLHFYISGAVPLRTVRWGACAVPFCVCSVPQHPLPLHPQSSWLALGDTHALTGIAHGSWIKSLGACRVWLTTSTTGGDDDAA